MDHLSDFDSDEVVNDELDFHEVKEELVLDYPLHQDFFLSQEQNEEEENEGHKKKQRALVYKLFEKQQGEKAMCILCSKVMSAIHGSTSSLRRHAASFHWAEWELVQSQANGTQIKPKNTTSKSPKNTALIYKIFDKQGDVATCKLCETVLSTMHGGTTTLRRHAASFHEQIWDQIQACSR